MLRCTKSGVARLRGEAGLVGSWTGLDVGLAGWLHALACLAWAPIGACPIPARHAGLAPIFSGCQATPSRGQGVALAVPRTAGPRLDAALGVRWQHICVLGGGIGGLNAAIKLDAMEWPQGKKPKVWGVAPRAVGLRRGGVVPPHSGVIRTLHACRRGPGAAVRGCKPPSLSLAQQGPLRPRVVGIKRRRADAALGHAGDAGGRRGAVCVQAAAVRAADRRGGRGGGGAHV